MISLHGKTALVTGGSRGVGRATVHLLAQAGAQVGFTFRSRETEAREVLEAVEQHSGGWAHRIDLSRPEEVPALIECVREEFADGLDFFIANAGIWPPEEKSIEEMDFTQWRQTMAVNLDSVFLLTKALGPHLKPGGRIVYVSSTAGQRGEAFHVDYAASKGALISMVKSLCVEYAPRNITVNAVAPGWIDTEMCVLPFAEGGRERIEAGIPLGRVAGPEDVAGPIVFLCSELARHITGEILNVNGGAVLCG